MINVNLENGASHFALERERDNCARGSFDAPLS